MGGGRELSGSLEGAGRELAGSWEGAGRELAGSWEGAWRELAGSVSATTSYSSQPPPKNIFFGGVTERRVGRLSGGCQDVRSQEALRRLSAGSQEALRECSGGSQEALQRLSESTGQPDQNQNQLQARPGPDREQTRPGQHAPPQNLDVGRKTFDVTSVSDDRRAF